MNRVDVHALAEEREQALSLLHATLESTADAVLVISAAGKVSSFNRRYVDMWGETLAAVRAGDDQSVMLPTLDLVENRDAVMQRIVELTADPGAESRDELKLVDGRTFERYSRPQRIGDQIVGRVWSFRDVTDERAALVALHRREEQLAEAQGLARIGSWEWNLATGVISASDELWRITGYEANTFVWTLELYLECVHPDDREMVSERIAASLRTLEPFAFDSRFLRGDGSVTFVASSGRVVTDATGAPARLFGTVQDVTERTVAAAALERRVRIEQSLTQVSRNFAASATAQIDTILRILGEANGADRVYIFQSRAEGDATLMDNTHEWCAAGVAPAIQDLQDIDTALAPWWMGRLEAGESIVLQTLDELPPEAAVERSLFELHDVVSVAAVPISDPHRGLLGFLGFDYVEAKRIQSDEDVRALQTSAEMLVTHFARQRAEREILQRDAILQAVSFTAERFLRANRLDDDLKDALDQIGAAAGASRSYLFENSADSDGRVLISQRAEWTAPGIAPQIDNPELQKVSLVDIGLGRWEAIFLRNEPIQEIIKNLPPEEQAHLAGQDIRSILLIPIYVGASWWGLLGFDDCVTERVWSATEREVLIAAAGMIGAAIQRKQAEEALRESELRFTQLSDNIPEVFFMATVDMSELLYLSPAFERVWGRTLEEAYANPLLFVETIIPEDRHLLFADMAMSTAGVGDPNRHLDYRVQMPDESIRWIRNRIFQIPDRDGNPYRVAGVCSDITEQKQMEEELRRANRIEAIGHLAAGIAHEINTPIQYIGDNVRFLDETYVNIKTALNEYHSLWTEAAAGHVHPDRLAAVAEVIRDADIEYLLEEAPRATAQALDGVRRVAEIVSAMKEFSHPGTGEKALTDLNQAIRSTTTVARSEWKYLAELVTELDETLPLVFCHAGELNQAILNLVVNAAHAIADRQRAEGHENPGVITVSTTATDEFVEIRVRDTGVGIPEEIRHRIFDAFFTTKDVGRGTGQGLTFVHATIVDKHGGSIGIETEPGAGTTFIIRLPHGAEKQLSEAA